MAEKAIGLVKDGDIIGLGSGGTVALAVEALGRRVSSEKIKVTAVPTSFQIEILAMRNGLRLSSINEHPELELAIDGADQVQTGSLNLIKGGGAALTREKIVDSSAKKLIIIVDETKLTDQLGRNQSLPIEIMNFGYEATLARIRLLDGKPAIRVGQGKVGPVITDNGNFIVDVDFGEIRQPKPLNDKLKTIPGVVETGLFLDMASQVYVGRKNGSINVLTR